MQGFSSCRARADRQGHTVAFAEFTNESAASAAMVALQGTHLRPSEEGTGISIAFSKNPPRTGGPTAGIGRYPPPGVIGSGKASISVGPPGVVHRQPSHVADGALRHPFLSPPPRPATLYVEGVPADASEREVAHLFRPFPSFKGLRLRDRASGSGGRLCFVEFADVKCAQQAMAVLHDYVFDVDMSERRLKLSFARDQGGGNTGGTRRRERDTDFGRDRDQKRYRD